MALAFGPQCFDDRIDSGCTESVLTRCGPPPRMHLYYRLPYQYNDRLITVGSNSRDGNTDLCKHTHVQNIQT